MKIGELRALIKKLGSLQSACGAKGQAKDFAAVDELLSGREDEEIEEFVAEAKKALQAKPQKQVTKTQKLNVDVVTAYVERLKAENTAKGQFENVFQEMCQSKLVRKAEAVAIAQRFIGAKLSFKSKKDALDKIHSAYVQERLYESKKRTIERMAI